MHAGQPFYDKNIEPLFIYFLIFFHMEKAFIMNEDTNRRFKDSLGNYSKSLLLCPDPRWRMSLKLSDSIYCTYFIQNKKKFCNNTFFLKKKKNFLKFKYHGKKTYTQ
jgi:hypothetical protein